jgi:OTU domain-containing protein 3
MGSDGNCLFRAISDQLEGDEKFHRKYRQDAYDFIEQNKEQYAPFIEDDETIDQYLSDLIKDGIWGGQIELQALSLKYSFNFIVH